MVDRHAAEILAGRRADWRDVPDDGRLELLREDHRCPGVRGDADAKRSFIGRARWHRGHAADPRYRPEVITAGGDERMRWDRWSGWPCADHRWAARVIDTTARSEAQSAAEVRRWIGGARAGLALGRLGVAAGKWCWREPAFLSQGRPKLRLWN